MFEIVLVQDFKFNYEEHGYEPPKTLTEYDKEALEAAKKSLNSYPTLTHYTFNIMGSVVWQFYLGKYYSYCGINNSGKLVCLYRIDEHGEPHYWRVLD